jgi:hypothetical protein
MKYSKAFIDKIQATKTSEQLIDLWKDVSINSFLNLYVNLEMPEETVEEKRNLLALLTVMEPFQAMSISILGNRKLILAAIQLHDFCNH